MIGNGLTSDVQPRVFEERFPNSILYVTDVTTGVTGRWKRIFLADVTPPESRPPGSPERGDDPRITLASEAIVVADPALNRLQLSLRNGSTYEAGKDTGDYRITAFPAGDQALEARKPAEVRATRPSVEMDTRPLYRMAYHDPTLDRTARLDARTELQSAAGAAAGLRADGPGGRPAGHHAEARGEIRGRGDDGRAGVSLLHGPDRFHRHGAARLAVARSGGVAAQLAFRDRRHGDAGAPRKARGRGSDGSHQRPLAPLRGIRPIRRPLERLEPRLWLARFSLLPRVTDTYVLSSFLFYFVVLLASFVLMFQVFTFFELLSDIIRNRIGMDRVLAYHFFLTPRLIYELAPFAVLTAVLVSFGILTKHNEVTALKACGVSVYRLAAPILVAGVLLSGALFAFDHYWVPEADRRQDALRAEIKGRPAQTFLRPDRRWISGLHDRMFYYKYFDQAQHVMLGVNVFEIDPARFRLKRHISAERARWEPSLNAWVFENGWSRDMNGNNVTRFDDFSGGTRTFPELEEPPDYFVKEVKQSRQMNFHELGAYIGELQQSGFDTVALQVQLQKKFSVPLFALIMAMVSIPFAFLAGNRGAMAGVGVSLGIAIVYWSVGQVFEQFGNLSQLPVQIAAWSPDAVFSLAGLYFLARMRT